MKKVLLFGLFITLVITFMACQKDVPDPTPDPDPTTYTVTFNTGGGTTVPNQVIEEGNLVSKPDNPILEGYIFTGIWLLGEESWDFDNDLVTSNITLTAFWVDENEDISTESVVVSTDGFVLPEANNAEVRVDIPLLTAIEFSVDFLPWYASNQGFTISTSNSRAEVNGNVVSFVYGITGLGNVSVFIDFDDVELPRLEYRFKTIARPTSGIIITEVTVTSGSFTLPIPNNSEDRPRVLIGTEFTLLIDILPENAANKNYTVTASNTRAVVDDHTVTFMLGETGVGNVSIRIFFEDSSVGNAGMLEYRFETFEEDDSQVLITDVTVTAGTFILPNVNDIGDRPEVEINTVITLEISILPLDASNTNYTITSSNSRAVVDGHTVTFVYGATGPGSVSIRILFEDTSVGVTGLLEYRFATVEGEPPAVPITDVTVTAGAFVLPNVNDIENRLSVALGTAITLDIDILPINASNQNYVITTSNSRAIVDGHTVTFVYGLEGLGSVSIHIQFEDISVGVNGLLEYRFTTTDAEPISEVTVTAGTFILPNANDIADRPTVEIGTIITLEISILPAFTSNHNYTITSSNSRAVVDGHTVTFVYGLTGPGNVSIRILFEDTSVGVTGLLEYRFATVEPISE